MPKNVLEVDESLIQKNLLFNKNEEDFQTLLSAAMEGSSLSTPNLTSKELVKTVHPIPGICVKTQNVKSKKKVFINLCHTSVLPEPMEINETELTRILESDEPSNYRVPMSIGEPHEEHDKSGQPCTAYDIAINSKFFDKVTSSLLFQTFVLTAAIEGLEDKHNTLIDKNGWIVLKNRRHLGTIKPHHIRYTEERPPVQEIPKPCQLGREKPSSVLITEVETSLTPSQTDIYLPHYSITRAMSKDGHAFVIIDFVLHPGIDSKTLNVSVGGNFALLEASDYQSNVCFPFMVDSARAKAAFSLSQKMVTVLAPVKEQASKT